MIDLEKIDITNIQSIVFPYGNLFYHRTVILERIRKIAFRNMCHLTEATEHCNNRTNGKASIECIQAKMLRDQGLENNKTNRTVIGWATFYPLQLYLALFYAEIESFEKLKKTHNIYADDELDSYLETNKELICRFRKFRHSFLHPSQNSIFAELQFLQVESSYNLAPILQGKFDGYLQRLRSKLSNYLLDILNRLPEIQRLYCFHSFLGLNLERMNLYHDLAGMERCVSQIEELSQRITALPDRIQSWLPNQKQTKVASRIAQCLNEASPAWHEVQSIQMGSDLVQNFEGDTSIVSEVQSTDPVETQTAMQDRIIAMLASGRRISNCLGSGRHATHLKKNIGFYIRILITSIVLWNEFLYEENSINLSLLQKNQQYPFITQEERMYLWQDIQNNFSLQDCNEWVAPHRVNTALFYELLRIYRDVSKEDPSVANRKLDAFTSSKKLKKFGLHRNSIFHVLDSRKTSAEADLMSTTSGNMDIYGELTNGILEFWGV